MLRYIYICSIIIKILNKKQGEYKDIVYLSQKDFKEGSFIIKNPGSYFLTENIIFDPPKIPPKKLLRKNPAFLLGFFAAIVIQTDNVILNLNNFKIKQSMKHYLNQRFYSHIELGSSPFIEKEGPHDFTKNFIIAKNIIIENGFLGLSAHHGIHGNNCEDVLIRNLEISNFEVGGISINGGVRIEVTDILVGPSSIIVPVSGAFSTGMQIIGYLQSLDKGGFLCFEKTISKNNLYQKKFNFDDLNDLNDSDDSDHFDIFDDLDDSEENYKIFRKIKMIKNNVLDYHQKKSLSFLRKINQNLLTLEKIKKNILVKNNDISLYQKAKVPFIKIRGKEKTIKEVLQNLKSALKKTEKAFLQKKFSEIPKIFQNESNLPDGSAIYGVLFHVNKPAVKGFNNLKDNEKSQNIKLKNILIKDLINKTKERVALQVENEKSNKNFEKAQIDVRGSSFDILTFTDETGAYISNPIGDAQLIVSKYKKCLSKKTKEFFKLNLFNTNTKRDSISPKILKWASLKNPKKLINKYICNSDQMLHSIKGSISLRLSGVNNVILENINIKNIKNLSDFGSKICGNYNFKTSFQNSLPGYLGADIRGISIESSKNINLKNIHINNLKSNCGNVIGLDVMFQSKNIEGYINANNLETISWKHLPKDFSKIPQAPPFSHPLNIFNKSRVSIIVKNFSKQDNNKITTHE